MAERPIFTPSVNGPSLVWTHSVEFKWFPGMSIKQVQKSVVSLHEAALRQLSVGKVLEISTKSLDPVGVKLSAFNLMINSSKRCYSVECAFQASKVFEHGGPYLDLLEVSSKEAKLDPRLKNSGHLKGFEFYKIAWPLEPRTAFYDWLYINALHKHPDLASEVLKYRAFSDIVFNPERSVNCQAHSAALYVALHERGMLQPEVLKNRDAYLDAIKGLPVSNAHENTVDQPRFDFEAPDHSSLSDSSDKTLESAHEPEDQSRSASNELRTTFLRLREQCIWIQACFNTFIDLFESGDVRHKLMDRTAPLFFHDLNRILYENYILQVCKLSDPPHSMVPVKINGRTEREKRSNLTVAHVNELLLTEDLLTSAIEAATAGIMRYRSLIEAARNRTIGHADKETAMTYVLLGAHRKPEASAFLEYLHAYVNAVGIAVGEGPLDFSTTSASGDVADLFKAMNNGDYLLD